MTDEQINAAIAEACGWTEITKKAPLRGSLKHRFIASKAGGKAFIPSYCTDLNAMHEAEHKLPYVQLCNYIDLLIEFSPEAAVATARQRAEAFLRTLGKWEEVQG